MFNTLDSLLLEELDIGEFYNFCFPVKIVHTHNRNKPLLSIIKPGLKETEKRISRENLILVSDFLPWGTK